MKSAVQSYFSSDFDIEGWHPILLAIRGCVSCNSTSNVSCTTCSDDETCQLTLQTCSTCSTTYCIAGADSSASAEASSSAAAASGRKGGTNVGAIVGGTVGGLAAIAIIAIALFFFYRRKRVQRGSLVDPMTMTDYVDDEEKPSSPRSDDMNDSILHYGSNPEAAQSSHTVASIASSAVTRASNVIPIAYIPGVINRSNPNSPSYVPPIPEIPAEHQLSEAGVSSESSDGPSPSYPSVDPYANKNLSSQPSMRNSPQSYYDSLRNTTGVPFTPTTDRHRGMSVYSGATYDSQDDESLRASINPRDSTFSTSQRTTVFGTPAVMTAVRARPNLIER
ncbi:uncharacterized protein V1516DRAFT_679788 [Lipomyces oligophaga]|uniref:uncharacterized protein n=1 Tax=Lipomyces oligophaga TaxID=45792 RepID=UPI0034CD169B